MYNIHITFCNCATCAISAFSTLLHNSGLHLGISSLFEQKSSSKVLICFLRRISCCCAYTRNNTLAYAWPESPYTDLISLLSNGSL